MMAYERSKSAWDNFGRFIHQFQLETKTLIRKLERIIIKFYRQNVFLLSNETGFNERLLLNHTHTHTHTTQIQMCDILLGLILSSRTSSRQTLFSKFFYLKACEESGRGIVVAGKLRRDLKSNVSGFIQDFLF